MIITKQQVKRWEEEDNNIYRDNNGRYMISPEKLQSIERQRQVNNDFKLLLGFVLVGINNIKYETIKETIK